MRKKETYELDKVCAYCERATVLAGGEHVLCEKKGVVSETYHCRKFVYDPLKRKPARIKPLPETEISLEELAALEKSAPALEGSDSSDEAVEGEEKAIEISNVDLPDITDIT